MSQVKSALVAQALGALKRTLGSYSGGSAPRIFRNIGGPLTGSLVQGAIGAGLGYGAGRLANWVTGKKTNLPLWLALAGAGAGPAMNSFQLATNRKFNRPWNYSETNPKYQPRESLQARPAPLSIIRDNGWDDASREMKVATWSARAVTLVKAAGTFGMTPAGGGGISVGQVQALVASDMTMGPMEKVKMMQAAERAAQSGGRSLSAGELMGAAVDAGVGYLMGRLLAKLVGGLSPSTERIMGGVGAAGGLARGLGVWP